MIRKPTGPRRPKRQAPKQPAKATYSRTSTRTRPTRTANPKAPPPAPAPPRPATPRVKIAPQVVVPVVLSTREIREFRAKAHSLEPIVKVGHSGVNEAVVRAVNGALHTHELIKVRLHEPEDKHAMAAEIAQATRAVLCGLVGHTLILYRPRPKTKAASGVAKSSIRRNQPKPRRPPRDR